MTQEAGQTARSFIDALKDQPLSLALVVMNMTLLAFLYYSGVVAHSERQRETELLYQNRDSVGRLLANCYPGPPK
jgi:hypothetical protein